MESLWGKVHTPKAGRRYGSVCVSPGGDLAGTFWSKSGIGRDARLQTIQAIGNSFENYVHPHFML
jgi:hypothetical protein